MTQLGARGLALIFFVFTYQANAKVFRNAYVSFEHPPNWDCKIEGTEWVCVNKFAQKSKEAIIILTAKEVGPTDSIEAYETYLKAPKTVPDSSGKAHQSKVLHVRRPMINNQLWVDGMHLGSEVDGYYTRYLATIKNQLAILVTFSAHKAHYTKYTNDFIRAVKSLQVVASKGILNTHSNQINGPEKSLFGGPGIGPPIISDEVAPFPTEQKKKNRYMELLGLALLLAAVGIYILKKKS